MSILSMANCVGELKHCCRLVQILRSHVMVRIGGGWDTLESYLDRHDPCRCNSKRKHLNFYSVQSTHL